MSIFEQVALQFTHMHLDNGLPDKPQMLNEFEIDFIDRMVNSELEELAEADSVIDQQDAFVDAIYYLCDQAARKGWNLTKAFQAVHAANLRKFPNGVVTKVNGKVVKPEGWVGPDAELIQIYLESIDKGSW